jgi:hypothetical protein
MLRKITEELRLRKDQLWEEGEKRDGEKGRWGDGEKGRRGSSLCVPPIPPSFLAVSLSPV